MLNTCIWFNKLSHIMSIEVKFQSNSGNMYKEFKSGEI